MFSGFKTHSLNIVVAGGVGGYFFVFKDTSNYGNVFGVVGWSHTTIDYLGKYNNGSWEWES